MLRSDLVDEIAAGVAFWGWEEADALIGVMGLQKVRDATLSLLIEGFQELDATLMNSIDGKINTQVV